jgi:hypothetical protein
MWTARNKSTGREYPLTNEEKAYYETSPHLKGKYTFEPLAAAEQPKRAAEPTGDKKAAAA